MNNSSLYDNNVVTHEVAHSIVCKCPLSCAWLPQLITVRFAALPTVVCIPNSAPLISCSQLQHYLYCFALNQATNKRKVSRLNATNSKYNIYCFCAQRFVDTSMLISAES